MDSNNKSKLSRKEFLKLSGMSGLFFAVPYRQTLQHVKKIIKSEDRVLQANGFITKPGVIGQHHDPNFVDVYYEQNSKGRIKKDVKANIEGAKGFWKTAEHERKHLVCESANYKALLDLEHPSVEALFVGDRANILGKHGIWLEVEDGEGTVYSSRLSTQKARQNTWRAGLYYYDAHLLDFNLTDGNGHSLPVQGELVLNCFPDKIHIEGLFHVEEDCHIWRAELRYDLPEGAEQDSGQKVLSIEDKVIGIAGGNWHKETIVAPVDKLYWEKGDSHRSYMALLLKKEGSKNGLADRVEAEKAPLAGKNFKIKNGIFKGYDPAKGVYRIEAMPGSSAEKGFNSFFDNPNMYLETTVEIQNDVHAKRIYLLHESSAGPIEAAVLTDSYGFILPVQVQACKNFGGEMEEPIDEAFSESYYPLDLESNGNMQFRSLHIHQNWGKHALRQLSSIRFFQIYYHLSQGVTETTCFSLPTKFGSIPSGQVRAYTLADYRPLSGQTWSNSPQHHHVALQGWLQYKDDQGKWRYPHYKGTRLLSVGPNLAWFVLNYISSDGKVEQQLEFFEMPQDDESRTFMRCRFHFKESVTIQGDIRHNLRLINKGSYIRKVQWKKLSWRDRFGKIKTKSMTQNGRWSAEGIPLRPINSFFCGYPHIDGNDALVIRKVGGQVNGKVFQDIGFSAIGHKDGKSELMLVPLIEGNTIEAGSDIELDCILMPYGDDRSSYYQPMEESIRFGLNTLEYKETNWTPNPGAKKPEIMGPEVEVLHGKRLRTLPPTIRTEDNWAAFRFSGGHNWMSMVVTGFKSEKLPMLWKGKAFLDPQVAGGDGYQMMENSDGSYCAVFVASAWTTRANNEWSTREEEYYATQAISEADIASVSSLNGAVKLRIEGEGKTIVQSPRLWCPAINSLQPDQAIHSAKTKNNQIKTVPIDLVQLDNIIQFGLKSYSSEGFEGAISCDGYIRMRCSDMYPNAKYLLTIKKEQEEITSNEDGLLDIRIPGGKNQPLICKYLEK